MSKGLGALVFAAGVAGLTFWGARVQAVSMQEEIAAAAQAVAESSSHPLEMRVSGRDITVTGVADTEAELAEIVEDLDALRGRRVVNAAAITVLPAISPYETALAKGADGALEATGYAPSEAAKATLAAAGLPVAGLPLGSGAPEGWTEAVSAGAAALDPLEEGSFAVTGDTLTLQGTALTPVEDEAARAALTVPGPFETVVAVDVTDPGVVDFSLAYDADTGFSLSGIVPDSFNVEDFAAALGADVSADEVETTFADLPGLDSALAGLSGAIGQVETLAVSGRNDGISAEAEALAGIAHEAVEGALGQALGPDVALAVREPAALPDDGTERLNPVTGVRQFAHGGSWVTLPAGLEEPTGALCAETAMARVAAAPIRFVTGSAELDPASMAVIEDLAGILNLCTRGPGMIVTIGGHTDATGEPEQNYVLSAQRARAVKDALAARGVPPGRMIPIGYGETEPVADNETEEGRALNRRTTFTWPD